MNESIGIAYFSGTGNTRLVADLLAEALRRRGAMVEVLAIEEVLMTRGRWDTAPYQRIGIGWPVHALDAPRIVYEFIRRLPPGGGKPVFTFRSAGDPFWNGGPTEPTRRALAQRGYRVRREDLLVMPPNVLIACPDTVARQLYLKAEQRVEAIASAILTVGGAELDVIAESPLFQRAVARVFAKAEGVGARLTGRCWRVTPDCTLCNRCVDECPIGNIARDLNRLVLGWDCLLCLRCVYRCPEQAIKPPPWLSFMVLKEGYDTAPMLDATHDEPGNEVLLSHPPRGFYGRLFRYLNAPPSDL
jgi:ferredoxin/flavodoxin